MQALSSYFYIKIVQKCLPVTIVSFSEEVQWKGKKVLKYSYQDTDKEGRELREGVGQGVQDGLLEVVEDEPALLDASDDGSKVVVLLSMFKNFFLSIDALMRVLLTIT